MGALYGADVRRGVRAAPRDQHGAAVCEPLAHRRAAEPVPAQQQEDQ